MSDVSRVSTRSPADVGYLPWLLQRISALVLIIVLAVHIAVQVYGLERFGIYSGMLDLTLGLVLLHGFLGVRSTVLHMDLSQTVRTSVIWIVGLAAIGLFVLRIVG
jgi:succinate dehydrogenase hydrophobic anchor subunit